MTSGGKRQGAGRPKNTPNKASARREQYISQSGSTPVDVMIRIMRHNFDKAEQELKEPSPDESRVMTFFTRAIDAATRAAPYAHPRLSAIDVSSSMKADLKALSDDELAQYQRLHAKMYP